MSDFPISTSVTWSLDLFGAYEMERVREYIQPLIDQGLTHDRAEFFHGATELIARRRWADQATAESFLQFVKTLGCVSAAIESPI